jgi:hypothetical protein
MSENIYLIQMGIYKTSHGRPATTEFSDATKRTLQRDRAPAS